ncbi:MAG: hypothetical protein Sylvanvirus4_19 [Sylvanvirus sp.]|uniref:Uncharacterized protein n=1 Tax=Sylvanvirus sp. TaxID=2487774 RepID=A0A3G5AHC0_9VIRU|nr:MAG: hypothetical protein Sylvanvirus4_19 [Sylvanvirus sp.]
MSTRPAPYMAPGSTPMMVQESTTSSNAAQTLALVEQTAWKWLWLIAGIVLMIVFVAFLLWLLRKSVATIKNEKGHHHHTKDIYVHRETPYSARIVSDEE